MADSATTRNKFRKQSLASNEDVWGDTYLNQALDMVDEALDGYVEVALTGASTTLSTTQYATNEYRQRMLKLTGTPGENHTITAPDLEKWWIIWNATTDGFTITFKNTSGTGVSMTVDQRELVMCDGSEVYKVESGQTLSSIGAPTTNVSMAGFKLTNLGAPTGGSNDAATAAYVDAAISGAAILPLSSDWGNTTTGTTVAVRGDTTANVAAYTGSARELVVDTTLSTVHVMDGSTAGGTKLARDADVPSIGTILALGG